jgi:hypothetical protein
MALNENGIPRFEDLPLQKGDPPHSAWGLYGRNDELGTLNRLTDERVVAAAKSEIHSGVRLVIICVHIALFWTLHGANLAGSYTSLEFLTRVNHSIHYLKVAISYLQF